MKLLRLTCCALSVYVLCAIGYQTFHELTPQQYALLDGIDNLICFVFLADFFARLRLAPQKLKFLKWGWLDFVSSIPAFGPLSWHHFFRVLRVVRALRSLKYLTQFIIERKFNNRILDVSLIAVVVLAFSAISVYNFEKHNEDANIKNFGDALWWSAATVSTVGYGDKYPVTTEGRLVAFCVMLMGAGLFGTFTAFVTSKFINDARLDRILEDNRSLHEKIDKLVREKRALQKIKMISPLRRKSPRVTPTAISFDSRS